MITAFDIRTESAFASMFSISQELVMRVFGIRQKLVFDLKCSTHLSVLGTKKVV